MSRLLNHVAQVTYYFSSLYRVHMSRDANFRDLSILQSSEATG